MILYWDRSFFPDGPADLFFARVRCLWETYGPSRLAEFWVQKIDDEMTAWLCRSEGCLTLSATASADWEELAEFVLFSGATVVYGSPQLVLPEEYTAKTGEILRWSDKGERSFSPHGLSFDVVTDPPGGRLYSLLAQCQSNSLVLPSRDGFLSDYTRRVRLGTGRAKLLCVDGEDVSAIMTTAEAPGLAVIGGVSVLPKHRGRGFAATALALMTDDLSRQGRRIFLAAGRPNLADYYQRCGFVCFGEWNQWQLLYYKNI